MRLLPPLAALALAGAGCASNGLDDAPADPGLRRAAEVQAAALFAQAEALRAKQEYDDARDLYGTVREDFPSSSLAGEAQYLEAECALADGSLVGAGELFAKYAEERPLSPRVREVEKKLYDIAERLIEEGKRGLFGTGIFTTSDEGVNLLRRLQVLLPTGTRADDALMRVGRWHAENLDYAEAELVLDELIKGYPGSEWRLEARFLLAWCYRNDNRGPEYDGEKLRRALAHYGAYIEAASADRERAAELAARIQAAREEVAGIEADLARKALAQARFYRRAGYPRAAVVVLRSAAKRWGATDPGAECARLAEELARESGVPAAEAKSPPKGEGGS
jgi:TolA-binding protein